MYRPSYLLLIVLLFFAAVVAFPVIPTGHSSGAGMQQQPVPVILQMGGPPPKGTVELSGKVIDVVGWPLAGVQVRAGKTDPATTDDDGRFRLRVAESESVPLTVAARGGMQGRVPAVLPQEDSVVLVAEPPLPWPGNETQDPSVPIGGSLSGEGLVEDEEGEPVAHAVVTVAETGASVRASEQGRYRISLPAQDRAAFHLIARDHDGRVVRATVEHTEQQKGLRPLPTLRVTTGHQVTGFLKDGSGNPADGAGLVLSGQGQVRRVVTGGDGGFGIRGLLAGEYELSTLPYKGWVGSKRELSVGEETQDVELHLRPERPLTIVIQNQAGEPQVGVLLVVNETDYCSAHGHSDTRGRVILRGLGDGELTFTARDSANKELEILRYDAGEQRLIVR